MREAEQRRVSKPTQRPGVRVMRKALPQALPAAPGTLAAALAQVPDPRQPYGWRPGSRRTSRWR